MKLIVGLGNPGAQYVGTRHNVGFEVVDTLAARLGWILRPEQFDQLARTKFDGLAIDGQMTTISGGDEKLLLLKPMTFMNVSGKAVQAAMAFYQLAPKDIVVVLDDLALPCGKIRLRPGGSSGGHNGLRDTERVLGTDQYPRLRLGIDPAPPRVPGKDYVLGRFTPEQRKLLDPAIVRAASAIVTWIDKGIELAMSQFNAEIT
ncbi:MAG TPA: aminoacyl-tRNA hydrolase [Tepidisphaeraceae bacterium]|nr:aminoacyl-tRNA hydrolase [Tepidisphaeraceae bacterium]